MRCCAACLAASHNAPPSAGADLPILHHPIGPSPSGTPCPTTQPPTNLRTHPCPCPCPCRQVHELLQRSFPREMLARFPLLAHQWPLVLKFQKQIQDTVGAALNSPAGLTTDEVADALAALAALQGKDAQAMLQLFLGSRRHMVQGLLKAAKADDGSLMTGSRVAEVLRQVGDWQAGDTAL
jgi:hypothetical protein